MRERSICHRNLTVGCNALPDSRKSAKSGGFFSLEGVSGAPFRRAIKLAQLASTYLRCFALIHLSNWRYLIGDNLFIILRIVNVDGQFHCYRIPSPHTASEAPE